MPDYSLLLVDDEPNILSSLRRLLRREGYQLHLASNGQEAMDILAQQHVDVIISDGRMPGMSGTELLKKVKAQHPDTIRMILSGYTDVAELAEALNEGEVFRFVLKPWNDEELKLTVRHALEHHRLARENQRLIEKIKSQNEELRLLNAGLERAVEEKTRDLRLRNRVLLLAQEILDQLPHAVIGIDTSGTIVHVNRKAMEIFLPEGTTVGTPMHMCLPEAFQQAVRETIETGMPQAANMIFQRIARVTAYPLPGEQGQTRGAVLLAIPTEA